MDGPSERFPNSLVQVTRTGMETTRLWLWTTWSRNCRNGWILASAGRPWNFRSR